MAQLSLAQMAVVPPIWLLQRDPLPSNPYDDSVHFFQRIRGAQNLDCFGIDFLITSAPPGYGLTVDGVGNHFDRTMVRVLEVATDSTALLHDGFIHESSEAAGFFMFTTWPLYGIDVQLSPGVFANFNWLCVFT